MSSRAPVTFERILAGRVMAGWFAVSVLSLAMRIGSRLIQHQWPVARFLLWVELRWLMLIVFAGCLCVVTWQSASRPHRFARVGAAAAGLFVAFDVPVQIAYRLVIALMPPQRTPPSTMLIQNVSSDLVYFSIVALGTVAVTLVVRAQRMSLAAAHEAAALEAQVADARVRLLRTQVQPALIRESLEHIEALLIEDPLRAEAAVFGLSDFLRVALQRAQGFEWDDAKEAVYARLRDEVGAECRGVRA